MAAFRIEQLSASTLSGNDWDTIEVLRMALSEHALPRSYEETRTRLSDPSDRFWIAREKTSEDIVGMATLTLITTHTADVGIINDVIVLPEWWGNGLRHILTMTLLSVAAEVGIREVFLTSNPNNPDRTHARSGYEADGFIPSTDGRFMTIDLSL